MPGKNARKASRNPQSPKAETIFIGKESFEIKPTQDSPCAAECPLGTNVKAYISLIAAGRFAEALEVVRLTNPFPGICGRVCPHPCEDQCLRGEIDEPISIAALKRFLADYELRRGIIPQYKRTSGNRGRVAVIGAGPAGLTCAVDIAREGCEVQVFEALPKAGGMMAFGIPAYRLPRDILEIEIASIESLGVEIKLNTTIGERLKFGDLTKQFNAVFIATGAMKPRKLGIQGEEEVGKGLIDWVQFLRDVSLGRHTKLGDRVVVVGGGNTAVDCARTSLRLGAQDVHIVYRRSWKEMPAYWDEVFDAEEEGIRIHFLTAPARLLLEKGKLVGVQCVRMRLGAKDDTGRHRPIPIRGSQYIIPCDCIIPAIGQELNTSFLDKRHHLRISDNNLLIVDLDTLVTSQKGIFAGGDAVTGPASVVDAIAAGHRATRSILRYLNGLPLKYSPEPVTPDLQEFTMDMPPPKTTHRLEGSRIRVEERVHSFDEINLGLSEIEAKSEALRCLRCGPCYECGECVGLCDKKHIVMEPASTQAANGSSEQQMLIRVSKDVHQKLVEQSGVFTQYRGGHHRLSVITASVITANIDEQLCRGCGMCEEMCRYKAVQVIYRGDGWFTAQVNEDMCRGCGTCKSVCPSGAIDQNYFNAERVHHLIDKQIQQHRGKTPIVVFACEWNASSKNARSREHADIVRVMCLGSVTPGDVIKAFERGAAGVLLFGCGKDACHYGFGRDAADANMKIVSEVLYLLGVKPERVRIVNFPTETTPDLASIRGKFLEEIEKIGSIQIGRKNE